MYWLEIIEELGWAKQDGLIEFKNECGELLAIFSSIGRSTK